MNQVSRGLAWRTVSGFVCLVVILGLVIFVPAGSLDFWEGWAYLGIFALSAALITSYLWKRDPGLLARRVNAGPTAETEKSQRVIQLCASIAFIGVFVLSGLDHRFKWSHAPTPLVIAGDILVALGFLVIFLVFRENTFAAATIEVADEQAVITTGPYALVRHPMYSGALIMLAGTPLALGSWWGLLMLIPFTAIIIWRLLDEEMLLAVELRGYREYRQAVRFRLVPFVW